MSTHPEGNSCSNLVSIARCQYPCCQDKSEVRGYSLVPAPGGGGGGGAGAGAGAGSYATAQSWAARFPPEGGHIVGRGLHSFTFQLNFSDV